MRTLFTVTARVIIGMVLLIALTNTASAQKLTGVKKVADHTSEIKVTGTIDLINVSFKTKDPVTGAFTTYNDPAGLITGTLNGNSSIQFYCIDLNHGVSPDPTNGPIYWDEGSTPEALTYILNNYYPANTSVYPNKLSNANEAAAIQMAIWHYSDNLDATTITDNALRSRTMQIIADADANAGSSNPLQTLQILPASQSILQGGTASFTVKATALDGTAALGVVITLSTTGGALGATSATTGSNGQTPTITLNNGSNAGTFVVTAKATVTLPQGTIYVAKTDPTSHQRIVLATPTVGIKEVSTTIVFSSKPSTCDLTNFTTFTQGGWGSPSNSTPGGILDSYFASVFPSGLTIGGNHTIKFSSAAAVRAFLPQGGTAAALTTNYVNPTSQINVLAGQVTALSLNVAFSAAGYLGATTYPLGSLYFISGAFAGKTVSQFLAIANNALGGANTGYSISDINNAADVINNNFDNGTQNLGKLGCTSACLNQLGGYLYRDVNYNGTKDASEVAIANVAVELLNGSTLVSSTTTDATGHYSFSNVANATYTIRIAASNFASGGIFHSTDQSKWYSKNSVTSANVTINCADNLGINFGFWKTCISVTKTADKTNYKVGDKVQYTITVGNCGDVQLHGGVDVYDALLGWGLTSPATLPYHIDVIEPGSSFTIPAANTAYTVKATDCDKLTNTVRAEGHPVDGSAYVNATASIEVTINCKASLGDKVWLDVNTNGIQDAGENGILNVTVELYSCGGAKISSTTTDANGLYHFTNLTPASYSVKFIAPSGYTISLANQGTNDAVDSDANASTGMTIDCVTLVAGETNNTVDCGMYVTPASIGDKVWIDANHNGIQDAGEAGKAGVTVKLFDCATTGIVGTTTTDANGLYKFDNLTPGSYFLQFTLPANYVFTVKSAGSNNTVDSDVYESTGKTDCVTLVAGANDISWDAGIYEQVGSIGDFVWEDTNTNGIQDAGENGISGVTVRLYNCGGTTAIATTTTDGTGKYLFNNLAAGSYFVEFVKPNGYLPTSKDAGSNDVIDSDADATTGRTKCIDLAAGGNDLTWDAGFYKEPDKADLKIEKTVNKINPNCGDFVTYTIKVTNLGPNSASNVVANDLLTSGLIYQSSTASVGSYNSTTGVWTVGTLSNGAYATLTITVKVDCETVSSAIDLGAARDFNLFVIEDLFQPSSDTQGKVAVGHNAILSDYSIGDQLPANSGDVLVVGNNLSFTSGDIFNGNVVYGNATNLPNYSVTIAGTLTHATPINFAAAKSALEGLSASLATYTVNGTTTYQWGGLTLTGTNSSVNVFKVNGSDLSSANDFQINVPSGSVALINITGTNVSWSGGLEVHGTAITNVLFNFYQATNITLSDIDVRGSILAPFAALNYNSGVVNGQVVVKSMTGNGQFNLSLFLGNIPVGKVITNVATVTSATLDETLSNNSASASISVNGLSNNNNGGGTTGVEDNKTELPKEFKLNQNYPNPFNPSTVIEFSIPAAGSYSLKVYNVVGQEVATLVSNNLSVGTHRVTFDASRMASGMYIYSLVGNNVNITRKMLLTK